MNRDDHIEILHRWPGRALLAAADGALVRSAGMSVFCSVDDGASWVRRASIPRSVGRAIIEPFRLACRLLRHEVRAAAMLADGTVVAATRTGLFVAGPGEPVMSSATVEDDGADVHYPMTLMVDARQRILWGEYWGNPQRRAVRMFVSTDRGRSYQLAYRFPPGEIRHLHNLLYDPKLDKLWTLAGDHGPEPGIGLMSMDFKSVDWLVKGEQRHRAVCAFDFGDRLIYGTDTELEGNGIYSIDKSTGRLERLAELNGSCIYGCRCGPMCVLSTTVEAAKVNTGRAASLWVSRDGTSWREVYSRAKDTWPFKLFQYGSLVLPRGDNGRNVLMFSGQAVRGIDGETLIARLGADATG